MCVKNEATKVSHQIIYSVGDSFLFFNLDSLIYLFAIGFCLLSFFSEQPQPHPSHLHGMESIGCSDFPAWVLLMGVSGSYWHATYFQLWNAFLLLIFHHTYHRQMTANLSSYLSRPQFLEDPKRYFSSFYFSRHPMKQCLIVTAVKFSEPPGWKQSYKCVSIYFFPLQGFLIAVSLLLTASIDYFNSKMLSDPS